MKSEAPHRLERRALWVAEVRPRASEWLVLRHVVGVAGLALGLAHRTSDFQHCLGTQPFSETDMSIKDYRSN